MVKIWYQSFGDLSKLPRYRASLMEHTAAVAEPDTVVTVNGVREGTYGSGNIAPIAFTRYPYLKYLNQLQMVDQALEAEKQGYDAFVNGCFHDPGLRETRSVVQIPVLSLAETSMLAACPYGQAFGVVTLCQEFADYTRQLSREYGMERRLAGITLMDPPLDELILEDPQRHADTLRAGFETACRALRAQGAEVIIPGDGNLNEALHRLRISEAAGLPVLDAVGALVKMAECYVAMRRKLDFNVSRAGYYACPPREQLDEVRRYYGLG